MCGSASARWAPPWPLCCSLAAGGGGSGRRPHQAQEREGCRTDCCALLRPLHRAYMFVGLWMSVSISGGCIAAVRGVCAGGGGTVVPRRCAAFSQCTLHVRLWFTFCSYSIQQMVRSWRQWLCARRRHSRAPALANACASGAGGCQPAAPTSCRFCRARLLAHHNAQHSLRTRLACCTLLSCAALRTTFATHAARSLPAPRSQAAGVLWVPLPHRPHPVAHDLLLHRGLHLHPRAGPGEEPQHGAQGLLPARHAHRCARAGRTRHANRVACTLVSFITPN